jgi:hypothetical protein
LGGVSKPMLFYSFPFSWVFIRWLSNVESPQRSQRPQRPQRPQFLKGPGAPGLGKGFLDGNPPCPARSFIDLWITEITWDNNSEFPSPIG